MEANGETQDWIDAEAIGAHARLAAATSQVAEPGARIEVRKVRHQSEVDASGCSEGLQARDPDAADPRLRGGGEDPALHRTVLEEAIETVDERMKWYGSPKPSFIKTAAMWSAYLGTPITARQVCMCLALLKISRDSFRPKRDNLVDIPGYARCAELSSEEP